ncbi:Wadjet anti-phage system protein JetD domain-containing protein [Paenibacillus sp. TAB 01]|uniref:Wadjet anti-phage system protein JetD domain-containing protein n=1 Tax=Paenibacillus sp. TAB 01 TaxID=3368988 RepID=UPI003750AD97
MDQIGIDRQEEEFKQYFSRKLLSVLLDKYEQSQSFQSGEPGKQRPQFVMSKSPFNLDYTDEMDFMKRQWMNDVMIRLELQGIIALKWVKFRSFQEVERIYLNWDMIAKAYSLSEKMPLRDKFNRLRDILEPLLLHPWSWIAEWAEKVRIGLLEGKASYLDLDSPSGYADLVRALLQLPKLGEKVISLRLFSQQVFQDSKHLEREVLKRLLSVVKQASAEQRETDEEWLDLIGLSRNPQYVYLCGPLRLRIKDEGWISTEKLMGGVGLSSQTIELVKDISTEAGRIITIENLASYHQWIEQREHYASEELVIYTGGFPHRLLQYFLSLLSLAIYKSDRPKFIMHWGDIDLGGIRIFEFLRNQLFPSLEPLWMNSAVLLKYEQQAAPISNEYASQIQAALHDPRYLGWTQVLQTMLECRKRLEQEGISEIEFNLNEKF